jgi:hypothetical protein
MVVTVNYFSDAVSLRQVRAQIPSLDDLPILVEEFEYHYGLIESIYRGTERVYLGPVATQDLIG